MNRTTNCADCPVPENASVEKMGVDMSDYDYVVALAGNPNTGKSTVFNALTGLRQHTGNWPGKTVSRAEGAYKYRNNKYKVIDLPGTYSLLSTSTDEEIARNFILFSKPDVTIIVADATRLERNLNLSLQVLEITDKAVMCLNLIDEAKRNGITIDDRALSKELGIPVIPAAARQNEGIPELLYAVEEVASGNYVCAPRKISNVPGNLQQALDGLTKEITDAFPGLPNARWVALRLLEGDQHIIDAVKSGDIKNIGLSRNIIINEE